MSNGKVHRVAGLAAGASYATIRASAQPAGPRVIETAGGALGGLFGAKLPDLIDPPTHPGHRSVGHGLIPVGLTGYAVYRRLEGWQDHLRRTADWHSNMLAYVSDPWERFKHWLMAHLCRLAAGALAGFIAGYASHLALDAFTPSGLPLFG